jgi:hypothetical protein
MTFNSVSHLVFDYQNHIEESEEFSMFDFADDMHEGYNPLDDEWNSYYDREDYDDESWYELGGVNAEA